MIAMREKPTVMPVSKTFPTITYDHENRRIDATVIISRGEAGRYRHQVAPICIPGSRPTSLPWTVIWTLVPVGVVASFGANGVVMPPPSPLPPPATVPPDLHPLDSAKVSFSGSPEGLDWKVEFINEVKGANFFTYDIDLRVQDTELGGPLTRSDLVIDPTIAVVPDPIT